jgi:hypothetical protein
MPSSAALVLVATSDTEIDDGEGALFATSDTESDDGEGALLATSGTEMDDGQGALLATSGTEIDEGQRALVATSGTELHEAQNAQPLPVVATASSYALPEAQDLAPVVLQAPSSSLVLPRGCFKVTCKNASMYGKKMRDVHIAGFTVESDKVIRFRSSDGKVAVGDLLVGVGRFARFSEAQRMMSNLIDIKDNKINDLGSLEVDMNLVDQVIFDFNLYWYKIKFKKICTRCQPGAGLHLVQI